MSKAIIPNEQREIDFYDDTVTAVVVDGVVYVPVRPLCDLIGVDWSAQRRRIMNDAVLSSENMIVAVTTTIIDGSEQGKRNAYDMMCLPLSYLNGWLFGISAKRVKESIREKLITYQRDCYNVLHRAFSQNEIVTRDDKELLASDSPQGTAYRLGLAIAQLAREQYTMGKQVDDNTNRIGLIEAQLSNPTAYVTQEQAQQISEGVKAISVVLGKRSGRNEFGGTYGELYRRYGITSYKHLPASRFDNCMEWLREWWSTITDKTDAPF